MTPNDRKYTKEHEWVIIEDGRARLGITAHAQEALGDIVYVELPQVGDTINPGDSVAVVESVKAVSNVYTPVGGEVLEANKPLEDEPERLNNAPYDEFIVVLAASEVDEAALLTAAEYDAFVATL